jgi:hypothetical protein
MVAAKGGGRLRQAPQSVCSRHRKRAHGTHCRQSRQRRSTRRADQCIAGIRGAQRTRLRQRAAQGCAPRPSASDRHPCRAALRAPTALSNAAVAGFDMDHRPPRNSDSIVGGAFRSGPPSPLSVMARLNHRQAVVQTTPGTFAMSSAERMSPPRGRPKEGSLPLGGKARSAKGAHISPPPAARRRARSRLAGRRAAPRVPT